MGSIPVEQIIAEINEASLDDSLWPKAAALIDQSLGTKGSHLLVMRWPSGEEPSLLFESGCENHHPVEWAEDYALNYFSRDERINRFLRLPDAEITYVPDLYSGREHKTSATFNELLVRSGGQRGLNFRLDGPEKDAHIAFGLTESLGGDGWSATQVEFVARLVPHIRQFVRVRQALAQAESLSASLSAMLDQLRLGVVLLDRNGRIMNVNSLGIELLQNTGIRDSSGHLLAWHDRDNVRLQRLIGNALPKWPQPGVGGSMTISPPLHQGAEVAAMEVHVVPLTSSRPHYGANRVSALVLLPPPLQFAGMLPNRELLANALGLTPAPSAVLFRLAEGQSVADIVDRTHRSEATVRWHIKEIKAKLRVSRQSDLVRLAHSVVDPRLRPAAEIQ